MGEDLLLVIEKAEEWAGEYGFVLPEEARKVCEACDRLRGETNEHGTD